MTSPHQSRFSSCRILRINYFYIFSVELFNHNVDYSELWTRAMSDRKSAAMHATPRSKLPTHTRPATVGNSMARHLNDKFQTKSWVILLMSRNTALLSMDDEIHRTICDDVSIQDMPPTNKSNDTEAYTMWAGWWTGITGIRGWEIRTAGSNDR